MYIYIYIANPLGDISDGATCHKHLFLGYTSGDSNGHQHRTVSASVCRHTAMRYIAIVVRIIPLSGEVRAVLTGTAFRATILLRRRTRQQRLSSNDEAVRASMWQVVEAS